MVNKATSTSHAELIAEIANQSGIPEDQIQLLLGGTVISPENYHSINLGQESTVHIRRRGNQADVVPTNSRYSIEVPDFLKNQLSLEAIEELLGRVERKWKAFKSCYQELGVNFDYDNITYVISTMADVFDSNSMCSELLASYSHLLKTEISLPQDFFTPSVLKEYAMKDTLDLEETPENPFPVDRLIQSWVSDFNDRNIEMGFIEFIKCRLARGIAKLTLFSDEIETSLVRPDGNMYTPYFGFDGTRDLWSFFKNNPNTSSALDDQQALFNERYEDIMKRENQRLMQ